MRKMTLEEAVELKQSTLWDRLKGEIDVRVDSLLYGLKNCSSEEFLHLQAEIRCWESFKHLPQDVIERETP